VLDGSLGEVAAHVPAVRVEHGQLAVVAALKDDELPAERLYGVRLAVPELVEEAEAVPTARIPVGQDAAVDAANRGCAGRRGHVRHVPSMPPPGGARY